MNNLNLLLCLLGHPLLYVVLGLRYGILHTRMHVMAQGVHMRLFYTLAMGIIGVATSVNLDKLEALKET